MYSRAKSLQSFIKEFSFFIAEAMPALSAAGIEPSFIVMNRLQFVTLADLCGMYRMHRVLLHL